METKDVIYELRTKIGMSQEELAEKVYVTSGSIEMGKRRYSSQYGDAEAAVTAI